VAKKRGADNFSPNGPRPLGPFKPISKLVGSDKKSQFLRPLPFNRKFRPVTSTKDYSNSVVSEYNYASLWSRWRRGYELSMYAQNAYGGLVYSSFKYYASGTAGVGGFIPGLFFAYPSQRSDMRMHMVGIRPRDTFNFLDFGISVQSVTQYDSTTFAVVLSQRFGAPISFFTGEILSNRFNADGTDKLVGYNNYTVTAVGFNGVITTPSINPDFNTLFLSVTDDKSWFVDNSGDLVIPATGPPLAGEFLTTEVRIQCSCQDFLSRESFNFYNLSLKQKYPYTNILNIDPGFFDAGSTASERISPSMDYPGYARTFGFVYLNKVYTIPPKADLLANYSDPSLFYFQPRWCKHIYAAYWDMQRRFDLFSVTNFRLYQPNDEPMDEYYREKFEVELEKQTTFLKREEDLVWWLRYSPSLGGLPKHLMYSDKYNMIAKTLNFGQLDDITELQDTNFELFTIDQFNPLSPGSFPREIYDGGSYANGVRISSSSNVLDGGQYSNGVPLPPSGPPTFINGGTY